jgi:hypothetical protein
MDLINVSDTLLKQQQRQDYAGYDPFDGLNSKLFRKLQLHRFRLMRLAWLQAHKISPINLRPLLLVPRMRNPKGIALFILGLLTDCEREPSAEKLDEAQRLANWLLQHPSDEQRWQHMCWGYHFDWQARAFFVPKGKPNIITTSYVASALHKLYLHTGETCYQDAAVDAAYFISKHLLTHDENGREFFAYIPGEDTFVHNANLWGAATVARAATIKDDNLLTRKALKAAQLSADLQRDDGAWVYGARHHHQFVDGFHTGYNLEALDIIAQALNTSEFDSHISLGLKYYREHFFLPDGTPKYYDTERYPIDMHSSAQAILTFGQLSAHYGQPQDARLIASVMSWTMEHMYLPKRQNFRYQINKRYRNNINYARWTQAWAYYALTHFNKFMKLQHNSTNISCKDDSE